ncbi:hypothetical protein ACQ4M4_12700 [Leptolyngbya sp. AN02str]|uniref:hypothetical protein n=1 Tax=Leptolyngbya sp. AN02str TaxID=3423363 RepID=UPI003D3177E7
MTDNEKLIQILAETSQVIRAKLPDLLDCNPPPHVVHRYIEAWATISSLINDLGRPLNPYPVPAWDAASETSSREIIHSIAVEVLEPTTNQLQHIIERLEQVERKSP